MYIQGSYSHGVIHIILLPYVCTDLFRWSVGYDGSPIHFIDNSTLVHGSGNGLCLIHHSGRHVKSLPSHGNGVGPIATAPQAGTIVYAESTLNPKVFVISYPTYQLIATLKGMHKQMN